MSEEMRRSLVFGGFSSAFSIAVQLVIRGYYYQYGTDMYLTHDGWRFLFHMTCIAVGTFVVAAIVHRAYFKMP